MAERDVRGEVGWVVWGEFVKVEYKMFFNSSLLDAMSRITSKQERSHSVSFIELSVFQDLGPQSKLD